HTTTAASLRPALLLSLGLISTGLPMPPAKAQTTPSKAAEPVSALTEDALKQDALKKRAQELESARLQQKSAEELQQKLQTEIATIGQDRTKLNQQLIDIASQVREVETRIGDTEARLYPLDTREHEIQVSLDS